MNKFDKAFIRFTFELVFTVAKVVGFFGFRIYLGLFKIFIGTDADRITLIALIVIYYIRKGSGYDNLILKMIINLGLIAYIYGKSFSKMFGEKVENMKIENPPTDNNNNNNPKGPQSGSKINLKPIKITAKKAKKEIKKEMKEIFTPEVRYNIKQAIKDTYIRIKKKKQEQKQNPKVVNLEEYKKKEVITNE
jgi:hypothetical protein